MTTFTLNFRGKTMKEMYATMKLESIGRPRHPYAWLDRSRTTRAGVTSLSCFRNQPSNHLVDRMAHFLPQALEPPGFRASHQLSLLYPPAQDPLHL